METTKPYTKCDFCSVPLEGPAWEYECHDFEASGIDWVSRGAWVACPDCHALVKRKLWHEIALRGRNLKPMQNMSAEAEYAARLLAMEFFWHAHTGKVAQIDVRAKV